MWLCITSCRTSSVRVPGCPASCADSALRAMATVRYCRLCRSVIRSHHYLSVFSLSSTENVNWPTRIHDLLEVHVDKDDGLPGYVCSSCKRRVEVLEKAATDLAEFQRQAKAVYDALCTTRGRLKRTKETSGLVGVSPDTAKARPRAKRLLASRLLDFGSGKFPCTYYSLFNSLTYHAHTAPVTVTTDHDTENPPAQKSSSTREAHSGLSTLLHSKLPPQVLTVTTPLPLQGR